MSKKIYSPKKIVVFGGALGMGHWFIEKIFLSNSKINNLLVCDVNNSGLDDLKSQYGPNLETFHLSIDPETNLYRELPKFEEDDCVVFAVPLNVMHNCIKSVFPHLKKGTFVFDIGSIKAPPMNYMKQENTKKSISILGTHPLFGPSIQNVIGQTVVICQDESASEDHLGWLTKLLSDHGLVIVKSSPEEHDKAMLMTQLLTHIVYFSFAKTIVESNATLSSLLNFRTPPFTFLSAFSGRILGGSLGVYANIQFEHGEEGQRIRKRFAETTNSIVDNFEKSSVAQIEEMIKTIVDPWKGWEIGECQAIAASAINNLGGLDRKLQKLKNNEKICILKRADKEDTFHIGKVITIGVDDIVISSRFKKFEDGSYAVPVNDEIEKAFKKNGIAFKSSKNITIKKRFITVLSDEETNAWLNQNMFQIEHVFNFQCPAPINAQNVKNILIGQLPAVHIFQVLDQHKFEEGYKVIIGVKAGAHISGPQIKNILNEIFSVFSLS